MTTCPGPAADGVCGRPLRYWGLCQGHAEQRRRKPDEPLRPLRRSGHGKPPSECSFTGCTRRARSHLFCYGHYDQKRRGQELRPIIQRRPPNSGAERDHLGRKYCAQCDLWKPVEDFQLAIGRGDGYRHHCRPCIAVARIARVYGLDAATFQALNKAQGGACSICRSVFDATNVPAVDHDHKCCPDRARSCGKCVRGLLCARCNLALGGMDDDPERLRRAAEYVEVTR